MDAIYSEMTHDQLGERFTTAFKDDAQTVIDHIHWVANDGRQFITEVGDNPEGPHILYVVSADEQGRTVLEIYGRELRAEEDTPVERHVITLTG